MTIPVPMPFTRSLAAGAVLFVAAGAWAQPTADQVLDDLKISASERQRILDGEFVTGEPLAVSDRDLSISIAFRIDATPDAIATNIASGADISNDPQVRQHGYFKGNGSLADMAGLTISDDSARQLAGAKAGKGLNLSTAEISAFNALQGNPTEAIQSQLKQMLLDRLHAYRAKGLAGVPAYDRGGGSTSDFAADQRKASQATPELAKYMPAFHKVLTGYPQAKVPGMQESFLWLKYDIEGTPTFVLTHMMIASEGPIRVVVQRQFYVSTGYNGGQAVTGLFPDNQGSIVVYANHTFTDQVAGFGGSMKRGIGRSMMETKLEKIFSTARQKAAQ